jgi:hypothetical protein
VELCWQEKSEELEENPCPNTSLSAINSILDHPAQTWASVF